MLNGDGTIDDTLLYTMGIRNFNKDIRALIDKYNNGEEVVFPSLKDTYDYEDLMNVVFKVINPADVYSKSSATGLWEDKSSDIEYMSEIVHNGHDLKIVGIVLPAHESKASVILNTGINYSGELNKLSIEMTQNSQIVKEQLANPEKDVLSGETFEYLKSTGTIFRRFDFKNMINFNPEMIVESITLHPEALDFSDSKTQEEIKEVQPTKEELQKMVIELMKDKEFQEFVVDFLSSDRLEENTYNVLANATNRYFEYLAEEALWDWFAPDFYAEWMIIWEQVMGDISDEEWAELEKALEPYLNNPEYEKKWTELWEKVWEEKYGDISDEEWVTIWTTLELLNPYPKTPEEWFAYPNEGYYYVLDACATLPEAALADTSAFIDKWAPKIIGYVMEQLSNEISGLFESVMNELLTQPNIPNLIEFDEKKFQQALKINITMDDIRQMGYCLCGMSNRTLDSNLADFGYANFNQPTSITVYPKSFDAKTKITDFIDRYNQKMIDGNQPEKSISYSDTSRTIVSAVTLAIGAVSSVLIACISLSLIVSSLMVGIISGVSTLQRRKEIGILRALGARKRDIKRVFNVETCLTGLFAGILGIISIEIIGIAINNAARTKLGATFDLSVLPWWTALILVLISVVLAVLAGLIPAVIAARKDPVKAIRGDM